VSDEFGMYLEASGHGLLKDTTLEFSWLD